MSKPNRKLSSFVPRLEQLEARRLLSLTTFQGFGARGINKLADHLGSHFAGNGSHRGNSQAASGPVNEVEPPNIGGQNNTIGTAQFLPQFGTGSGDRAAIDIAGVLGPLPPAVASVEDDGSITLANRPGLVAGGTGRVTASATIGDGPHGSGGTQSGDYDHYRVPAVPNQLLTVDVDVLGSTLNSVVAIYNSGGTLLALNDDSFNNEFYGFSFDSQLRFLVPANDVYSIVVFGTGSSPQANPFNSASGSGAASEGIYNLTILLESPFVVNSVEDDGSIPLANATGLTLGPDGKAFASGVVGDGLYGSAGTGTGDYDFFRVDAAAGKLIIVDVDTPIPIAGLDPTVSIFDSAGNELAFNDDDGKTYDSFISLEIPSTGIYYVVIYGYPGIPLADPFDSSSGPGFGSEGVYTATIEIATPGDVDFYSFDLVAGDIVGANVTGSASRLELYHPDGSLLIGSSEDGTYIFPESSPLPGGGKSSVAYVINAPGRYALSVSRGVGAYVLQLRDFRPMLEQQPVYGHQILFLDFDGATVNASELFDFGPTAAHLSPLSSFLPGWGLTSANENAVIDAIIAGVAENLVKDVSGVIGRGLNGDFMLTDRAGEYRIEILNSRDHADPFGLYPNVSRVVVGGTQAELGVPFDGLVGIAQTIDVGNFDTAETAVALMDVLSGPPGGHPRIDSLNALALGPGKTIIDLIGEHVGNLVSHEAGHFLGNWHVDSLSANVMNSGSIGEIGPDNLFGTPDDPIFDFGPGAYRGSEGFLGTQDTLNVIAFGLSTGTQAGTYFDFVTGTLYVTGNIDDGHKDELEVKSAGSNLKIYINDELVLSRPAAGVNRVFLNGSSDKDELDAADYYGSVTLHGRGGKDELEGGANNDLLFGGDGNDQLYGGPGNDLLFGEAGNDALFGDGGHDVLVGGDGDDDLDGGPGTDVLIGGLGKDQLFGGGDGDLLIGSRSSFDNSATALSAILAEWSSGRGYGDRVANLRGVGTGPRANASYFLKVSGPQATVFDDTDSDKLTGGSGRDWFFARLTGAKKDKIHDQDNNEFVDML